MTVRLGFAVATAMNPDVVLLDEVLAVGDMSFRSKCYERIGRIIKDTAVIFVTHDMTQVLRICDQCIVLKDGRVAFHGPPAEAVEEYLRLNDQPFESSLVLHPRRSFFPVSCLDHPVEYGGKLQLRLEFDAETDLEVGFVVLSLSSVPGTFDAQSDISPQLTAIPGGHSGVEIELGPVFLRMRSYYISISVSDESRKITLAHAIGIAAFNVNGPLGHGMPYQIPAADIERHNGPPRDFEHLTAADPANGGN